MHDLEQQLYSEVTLQSLLRVASLPKHVAIIMDGNGRWATERGRSRLAGHREGVESARDVVTLCRELGISALTLYAFSLENWKRPKEEVDLLMGLFSEFFQHHFRQFLQEGVRFRAIGRLELLPGPIQIMIQELEEGTQAAHSLTVTLALSYSGRDEVVSAVNKIVRDAAQGLVGEGPLNEARFAQYLSTSDLPDPDLVIRTSGELRVSNFLLWQIAYSELYFTKTLWPDFRRRDMLLALLDYQARERRLGGLKQSHEYEQWVWGQSPEARFHREKNDGRKIQSSLQFEDQWMQPVGTASEHESSSFVSSWLD